MGVKTEQIATDDNDDFMDSDFGLSNDLDDCSETGDLVLWKFTFSGTYLVSKNQFKTACFTFYRKS